MVNGRAGRVLCGMSQNIAGLDSAECNNQMIEGGQVTMKRGTGPVICVYYL